jgi:hypothetical protein
VRLKDRVAILEGLVARLLREIEEQREIPERWPVTESPPAPVAPPLAGPSYVEPPATSVLTSSLYPQPHPDWLPVYHQNGPAACGRPGVYLTRRVSGVQKADPSVVRILPRMTDPGTGFPILEPYREPRSDDVVMCAGCQLPLELWSSTDLDYRIWLDNEIHQPMYPSLTQRPLVPQHISRAAAQAEALDARLATLKAQAESLHRNGRPEA